MGNGKSPAESVAVAAFAARAAVTACTAIRSAVCMKASSPGLQSTRLLEQLRECLRYRNYRLKKYKYYFTSVPTLGRGFVE
jgi:hypothetical protein